MSTDICEEQDTLLNLSLPAQLKNSSITHYFVNSQVAALETQGKEIPEVLGIGNHKSS